MVFLAGVFNAEAGKLLLRVLRQDVLLQSLVHFVNPAAFIAMV